jgi:MoaA/NifB/PqqE/SkfB family radical SAM enzyme
MLRLIEESFTLRRAARRLGWRPATLRAEAPERPVGVKFELTHSCNLRCGFCYTDSPRHTLSRTPDLPDSAWHALADQAVDLGVIEVVLSGGEPFLRRELTLDLADRLHRAGVGVTLNTNGWFVDDAVADRLAAVADIMVDVSIDGATPALHDAARGVPGSWRRAVTAVSRLLDRGVRVQVVHVVTPDNEGAFAEFLEQMWTLGVTSVRVTPVVESGAAARRPGWAVSRTRLRRTLKRARARYPGMRMALQPGNAGVLAVHSEAAPAAMLIRPSGAALTDALHPFAFGNAARDGLEACWRGVTERWNDPRIADWAGSLRNHRDIPRSSVVPYLEDEPVIADREPANGAAREGDGGGPRYADAPIPAPAKPKDDSGDPEENLRAARELVRGLALARRYTAGPARIAGGPNEHFARSVDSGEVTRLNRTAALVARALQEGSALDAVAILAEHHPNTERSRLEDDVLTAARTLVSRGILVPAGQPSASTNPRSSSIRMNASTSARARSGESPNRSASA